MSIFGIPKNRRLNRTSHIESIKQYNELAYQKDNDTWVVPFQLPNGITIEINWYFISLLFFLSRLRPRFPELQQPLIWTSPPTSHSIIGESGYITGLPELSKSIPTPSRNPFKSTKPLGKILSDIQSAFLKKPPVLLVPRNSIPQQRAQAHSPNPTVTYTEYDNFNPNFNSTSASHPVYHANTPVHHPINTSHIQQSHFTREGNPSVTQQHIPPHHPIPNSDSGVVVPSVEQSSHNSHAQPAQSPYDKANSTLKPIPSTLPFIKDLDTVKMDFLLKSKDNLRDWLFDTAIVQDYENEINSQILRIEGIIQQNQSNVAIIQSLQTDSIDEQVEFEKASSLYADSVKKQSDIVAPFSLDSCRIQLTTQIQNLSIKSKQLMSQFTMGEKEIEDFQREYRQVRYQYHRLKLLQSLLESKASV